MPGLISLPGPARVNFSPTRRYSMEQDRRRHVGAVHVRADGRSSRPDRAHFDVGRTWVHSRSTRPRSASVYAIEADVDNFALLLENVRANPELWPRISPHFVCVADEVRIGTVEPAGTSMSAVSSTASFGESAGFGARTEWSVPCVNFGDYLEEVERLAASSQPPIIAMDIEGAEAPALAPPSTASAAAAGFAPPLILELHPGLADDRVSYVASVCRVLALWPTSTFWARE